MRSESLFCIGPQSLLHCLCWSLGICVFSKSSLILKNIFRSIFTNQSTNQLLERKSIWCLLKWLSSATSNFSNTSQKQSSKACNAEIGIPPFCRTTILASLLILTSRLKVNPQFSPWGLIVNFEIWHGGLFEGMAYSREGAYWKGLYFTWGLIRNRMIFACIT